MLRTSVYPDIVYIHDWRCPCFYGDDDGDDVGEVMMMMMMLSTYIFVTELYIIEDNHDGPDNLIVAIVATW